MALTVPSAIFPSERRSLGIAKEVTPGTGVLPAYTIPVKGFVPEDKVMGLLDESLRSAMAGVYGYIQGPYSSEITIEPSPVYGDTFGHVLLNIMGDYTSTGTSPTSATTVSAASSAGATSFTVGSIGSIVIGSVLQFGNAAIGTAPTENLVVSGVAGSVVTFATTPLRFAHTTTAAVAIVTGPYTHVFSVLNGTGNAQPPSHTLTDNNYINSVFARWYPYSCFSEITITGNSEQLLTWSGKATGYANSIPGSAPTVSVSTVAAQPSWNSTIGIGGTAASKPAYNVTEWEYTITRVIEPYFTADGSQNPYVIGRGKLTAKAKYAFAPAATQASQSSPYNAGDYELLEYLNNNQPQTQALATNGLASTSLVTLQIDSQVSAFDTAVIDPSKALLGFNDTFECIGNTTNVGPSAGYSPLQLTLVNNLPTF